MTHGAVEQGPALSIAIVGGCVFSPSTQGAAGISGEDWARRLDPLSVKAVQCVSEARRNVGLPAKCKSPNQEGVCVGTGWGAQQTRIRYARRLVSHGISGTNPIDFPDSIDGAPAAHVALLSGFQGPSFTFVGGSEYAHRALVTAARQLESGTADRMHVVLGDLYDPSIRADAISTITNAPEDLAASHKPDDFVLALVLERGAPMRESGQCIYLVGYGRNTAGATSPDDPACAPKQDATGMQSAARVAGAWLGLTDPMGRGAFACQDDARPAGPQRCALANTQWPQLAFVRTEN